VREILVIGIGAGDPDHVTMQAVAALNRTQVFFIVDKGEAKSGLVDVRAEICRRHIADQSGYRVVEIADPPRDRDKAAGADTYAAAVGAWHEARAVLFEEAIAGELDEDGVGAFLVWGDPALYDSTLRVIDRILARRAVAFDYSVIPGITSVQSLTAAHRVPLNRIGEPIHITTGRRIADGLPAGLDSAVVMLDAGFSAARLEDPELVVYWGAYLGTPEEVLISGRLPDVAAEIEQRKKELREQHGWIMDTYLLRRERPEPPS
jgi:precorrin-6A synthase